MGSVRAHYVDGPLDGCTEQLKAEMPMIQIPQIKSASMHAQYCGPGAPPPKETVEYDTLTYTFTGVRTAYGTSVYVFTP